MRLKNLLVLTDSSHRDETEDRRLGMVKRGKHIHFETNVVNEINLMALHQFEIGERLRRSSKF
jgi:hypothetical protein